MTKNELIDRTILLVNTGSQKKKFILQKIKKLGLKIVMLHYEKNWASPYVDHWIITDLNNHKECIQQIKIFNADHPDINIEGVLTFWEDSVLLTSKIVDSFGFNGISFNIAQHTKNKLLFREYCKKEGLKTPTALPIRKKEDLQKILELLTFPIVLKPVYGASSAFVIKVEEKTELLQTYDYVKQNISGHQESVEWDSLEIYAEEYIDGDEVDIDIILQNGKIKFYSISDNFKTNEPFFIETGRATPSTLPRNSQKELIDMAEETLEKLEIQNGIIHFEAKINNLDAIPIEVNMRMGGDEAYPSIKAAWGVDLIENAIKIALSIHIKKIEKFDIPKKFITSTDFLSNYSGIVAKLHINKMLYKKKFVDEFHFHKKIGDTVLVPPEGFEYLGWITTSGENPHDASDNLDQALKYIHYTIAKFDPGSMIGRTVQKSRFSSAYLTKRMIKGAVRLEQIKRISRKNLQKLHIGIVSSFDKKNFDDTLKDEEFYHLYNIMKEKGYRVSLVSFSDVSKAIFYLKESDISLVINTIKKIPDSNVNQYHIASLLEIAQVPHIGSSEISLKLCENKINMRKVLEYHEMPLAKWDYLESQNEELDDTLKFPLIVKTSISTDANGRHNKNHFIANSTRELQRKVKEVLKEKKQALIEEYIEGDEYEVFILGNDEANLRALPLTRYIYSPHNPSIIQRPPKNISKKMISLITEIALDTFYILGSHDYALARIKIDLNNNPYLVDYDPMPSLARTKNFSITAELAGFRYEEFVEEIISLAVKRYKANFTNSFTELSI